MIVDASVLMQAFLPDENHANALALVREHVIGKIRLKGPNLLLYELNNAIWQAERRGRIQRKQADLIIQAFATLDIQLLPQTWEVLLPVARKYNRSAYDAAYLVLAQQLGEPFITGDLRLYNAVHPDMDWVIWIGDYPSSG